MSDSSKQIEGNYRALYQDKRLAEADLIVILLLPRINCLYRCIKREKEYRKQGYVKSLNFEFIKFVLLDGRTKERRQHYCSVAERYKDKTVVIKSQKQIDAFLAEWSAISETLRK